MDGGQLFLHNKRMKFQLNNDCLQLWPTPAYVWLQPTVSALDHMAFAQRLASFWNHPAGPKTIHFWAPTFKVAALAARCTDNRSFNHVPSTLHSGLFR